MYRSIGTLILSLTLAATGCGGTSATGPSTPPPEQPTAQSIVVKAFHEALNARNLDSAMALVADTAVMVREAGVAYHGRVSIRAQLQKELADGLSFTVSNFATTGDAVAYNFIIFRNGVRLVSGSGRSVVQKGLIVRDE